MVGDFASQDVLPPGRELLEVIGQDLLRVGIPGAGAGPKVLDVY